ncbi:iron-sulfur cluster repair di-iron protein [Clostridium formicaceticum]|uniref:Iron-sulfur cluster repair di-iron protein n=1 Tax=Clostridium formicaceticum TaxID=1497 RepID=A0AAC9WH93_9CLOT|nr:iron-sulfur cluster repair di-iron protein [Clostridium formicaceticum]AOY78045.1 iron-sulfur cluster repair di-iron protein [Clostridium formicaceticum]ARE88681.1 Iron-sulfur cluster repair protein YtfE [Clostridium formicaceticum]
MKKIFMTSQKIGEIATIFPKATDIFMAYEIDFCCGGDRPLATALKEQNINASEILKKLHDAYEKYEALQNKEIDWTKATLSELIDYIVGKHHTFMRDELPTTGQLLNKILKVHYVDHGETLSKLHKLFNQLKSEIEEHLIKEEELLFPLIKEYEKNPSKDVLEKVFKIMKETEDEHDNAGDVLKEMRRITCQYQAPSGGCNSFVRTYEKLQAIEADLFQHIHLENNILFQRLDQEKS